MTNVLGRDHKSEIMVKPLKCCMFEVSDTHMSQDQETVKWNLKTVEEVMETVGDERLT